MIQWLLVAVIVAATTIADVLQSREMKRVGSLWSAGASWSGLAALLRRPLLIASVAAMTISFIAFMILLSVADLSFAVPATAATYVIETVLARFVLREHVCYRRWAGALLVACGVALLV